MNGDQRTEPLAAQTRLPDAGTARRDDPARPAAVALGVVAAVAFVVLSLSDGGFEAGTSGAATVLVWWVAVIAILAGAWPRTGVPIAALAAGGALLGLTALSALSMLWAADLGAAYADAIRAAGYLGLFAAAAIASRAGYGRALLGGLAAGLVGLAAISLLSRLQPGFTGGAEEALGLQVSGGRLSYPLGYWNAVGACMAAGFLLCVWLAAGAGRRVVRAIALAVTPVTLLTLFFSGSRGGALAAAAGAGIMILAGPRRATIATVLALALGAAIPLIVHAGANAPLVDGDSTAAAARAGDELLFMTIAVGIALAVLSWRADRWIAGVHLPVMGARRVVTAAVIVGVLGLLVVDPVTRLQALDAPPESPRLTAEQETTRFANIGGSGRVQFWNAAVDAFESEPLRGIGAGGYEAYWNLNGSLDVPVKHAHSLFLESAAELGIGGLLLALALFGAPAIAGATRLRRPTAWADDDASRGAVGVALAVLGAGIVVAFVEWTWDVPAAFAPTALAAAFLATPPARAPGRRGSRRGLLGGGAFVLAGIAVVVAGGALFLSEEALESSREHADAGRTEEAIAEARRASDLLPFASEPFVEEAQLQREAGDLEAARAAINEAEERDTLDWRLWYIEAGAELDEGGLGRGVYDLNHARTLYPRGPLELFALPGARADTEPVILRSAERAAEEAERERAAEEAQ